MFIPGLAGAWESDIFGKNHACGSRDCVCQCSFYSSLRTGCLPRALELLVSSEGPGSFGLAKSCGSVILATLWRYTEVYHIQAVMVTKCFKH